jgi:hypothetical protein
VVVVVVVVSCGARRWFVTFESGFAALVAFAADRQRPSVRCLLRVFPTKVRAKMSQGGGIKKLAEAEESANRKIQEAKDKRAQRIQQAKNSAARQLHEIRTKLQADFEQQENQASGAGETYYALTCARLSLSACLCPFVCVSVSVLSLCVSVRACARACACVCACLFAYSGVQRSKGGVGIAAQRFAGVRLLARSAIVRRVEVFVGGRTHTRAATTRHPAQPATRVTVPRWHQGGDHQGAGDQDGRGSGRFEVSAVLRGVARGACASARRFIF